MPLTCYAVKHKLACMKKTFPEMSEYFAAMGKKGSRARARKLSPERRKEIARKAALARWARRRAAVATREQPAPDSYLRLDPKIP